MRRSAAFVLAGAALSCLGCGSSSDSDTDSGSGRTGTIVVSEALNGEGATGYEISASWFPSVEDSGCSLTTIDACIVVSCAATDTSSTAASLDAGQLSFTSSSGASTMLGKSALSYDSQSQGSFFGPGDTVTVTGSGGLDLPAFGPVSLVAPSATTLLAPACVAATCPSFDRSRDLTLTWTSQGSGVLQVNLGGATQAQAASCSFDLSAGSGTVPAPVLAVVPSSAALTFSAEAVQSTQFALGDSTTAFIVAELIGGGISPAPSP